MGDSREGVVSRVDRDITSELDRSLALRHRLSIGLFLRYGLSRSFVLRHWLSRSLGVELEQAAVTQVTVVALKLLRCSNLFLFSHVVSLLIGISSRECSLTKSRPVIYNETERETQPHQERKRMSSC